MPPNNLIDLDFFTALMFGLPGYSGVRKYGENPDLDTADGERTIWDFPGGAYIFPSASAEYYFSSSNSGDSQSIFIQGLDENNNPKSITFDLVGQTKTSIGRWRIIFRAFNDSNVNLLGNVYFYLDGTITGGIPDDPTTVKAYIESLKQQTQMLVFMTGTNQKAVIFYRAYMIKKQLASIKGSFYTKKEGRVERKAEPFGVAPDDSYFPPMKLGIKVDQNTFFRMAALTDTNDVDVGGVMEVVIKEVPNE